MENNGGNIPLFADKLLFAEDLVNYAMNEICGMPYEAKNAEPYRPFVYNAFNETIKEAVTRLFSQTEMTMFRFLYGPEELRAWDRNTYLQFAKRMHDLRFPEGFEAKSFLAYCVELIILAKKFRSNGLEQAPELAVYLIFLSLKEYDMFLGGWDTLNNISSNYLSAFIQSENCLTPDSFASAISDNELQNLVSQSSSSDTDSSRSAAHKTDADDVSSEESKGNPEMYVDSSADSPVFSVHSSSETYLSPYVSEDDDSLDTGGTSQSDEGSSKEPELHVVGMKAALTANGESGPENLEFPSLLVKNESLLKFEETTGTNGNNTKHETETLLVKNTSVLYEKLNTDTQVSMKELNVPLTDTFENLAVKPKAKTICISLSSGDCSKASVSCQSPTSFSSSASTGKGINPNNVFEMNLETVGSTGDPRVNKRFPESDCKSGSEKRLKLSQSAKTAPGDE